MITHHKLFSFFATAIVLCCTTNYTLAQGGHPPPQRAIVTGTVANITPADDPTYQTPIAPGVIACSADGQNVTNNGKTILRVRLTVSVYKLNPDAPIGTDPFEYVGSSNYDQNSEILIAPGQTVQMSASKNFTLGAGIYKVRGLLTWAGVDINGNPLTGDLHVDEKDHDFQVGI